MNWINLKLDGWCTVNTRKCIYCKSPKDITGEHIFPNFLYDMVDRDNYLHANKHKKDFKNNKGQVLKQVCKVCNNGPLSILDEYAKKFIVENNILDSLLPNNAKLNVDTNKLKKWISKIAVVAFPPQNTYGENTDILKMDDFFTESFRKEIITPEALLNENNMMVAFIDNLFYGIEETKIINIFTTKVSKNLSFSNVDFISVVIGQLAFITYRSNDKNQIIEFEKAYENIGFSKIEDTNYLVVTTRMPLATYEIFYHSAELFVVTKGYCLELLKLDFLINYLRQMREKPKSVKMQNLSTITKTLDLKKLDFNKSLENMVRFYTKKYKKILAIIDILPLELVQEAFEEHKKMYKIFDYYNYLRH